MAALLAEAGTDPIRLLIKKDQTRAKNAELSSQNPTHIAIPLKSLALLLRHDTAIVILVNSIT
jgi:hypothetical protein